MGNFCRNCGTALDNSILYCPACGYNNCFSETTTAEQPCEQTFTPNNLPTKPKKRKKYGCLISLLIALLIPCIFFTVIILLPDKDNNNNNQKGQSTNENTYTFAPTVEELYEEYTVFDENGSCGDNAFWKISADRKLLIIYGSGELKEADIQYEGSGWSSESGNGIKYLIVEEGITKMKYGNISSYDELEYVYLPSTLTELEPDSIGQCKKLNFVSFPNGNENYIVEDSVIFSKDKSVLVKYLDAKKGDSYEIPEYVKIIKQDAFSGLQYLDKLTVPATVTEIEGHAFSGNFDSLTEVYISDDVKNIGSGLFMGCYMLEKVHLPSNITAISDSTFNSCKSLKKIEIPYGVTEIGYMAFENCEKLEVVTIPETVKIIWGIAFSGCKNLKSLTLPKTLTYIGHDTNLKHTNAWVFKGCTSLNSIIIPKGTQIRASSVFKEWTAEQTIYFEDTEPGVDWDPDWYENCSANIVWGYNGFALPVSSTTKTNEYVKTENYIGQNIMTVSNEIGDMTNLGMTDGCQMYQNDFLLISTSSNQKEVSYISITCANNLDKNKCKYALYEVYIGQDANTAVKKLTNAGWIIDSQSTDGNGTQFINLKRDGIFLHLQTLSNSEINSISLTPENYPN